MNKERLKELAAMAMIGDGVLALLYPQRHMALWKTGPDAYRELVEALAERPALARVLGALEAGLGLWWASRQIPR